MNGKVIMAALGDIMGFAEVKSSKKHYSAFVTKILPLAACLCMVIMAVIFLTKNNDVPQVNYPGDISNSNIIWGDGVGDNIVEEYGAQAMKGTIIIADSLKNAMINSDNENDLFAVMVTEMTGATSNDIYNIFVKPLNINEEYLKMGVIFMSQNQITALECPYDFSLVLSLAVKPYEDKSINREMLDTIVCEKIKVKVYLKYNVDDILSQYKEQLSGLSDEEYQQMRQLIIKAEISQIINGFIVDYGMNAELLDGAGIYIPEFTAELDIALIKQILEDERVELVLEATDNIGLDQTQ